MTRTMKSALGALAFTVLASSAAFAADCACCKEPCKMECCDKGADAAKQPGTEHQH